MRDATSGLWWLGRASVICALRGCRDPNGAMLALESMMRKQIVMPAHLMDDNVHQGRTGRSLFTDFATVAEDLGVYTPKDYVSILEHLLKRWNIAQMKGDAPARLGFKWPLACCCAGRCWAAPTFCGPSRVRACG
jgi:Fatty acid desaturase